MLVYTIMLSGTIIIDSFELMSQKQLSYPHGWYPMRTYGLYSIYIAHHIPRSPTYAAGIVMTVAVTSNPYDISIQLYYYESILIINNII